MKQNKMINLAVIAVPLITVLPSPGTGVGYEAGTKNEKIIEQYVNPIKNIPFSGPFSEKKKKTANTYTTIPTKWIKVK